MSHHKDLLWLMLAFMAHSSGSVLMCLPSQNMHLETMKITVILLFLGGFFQLIFTAFTCIDLWHNPRTHI